VNERAPLSWSKREGERRASAPKIDKRNLETKTSAQAENWSGTRGCPNLATVALVQLQIFAHRRVPRYLLSVPLGAGVRDKILRCDMKNKRGGQGLVKGSDLEIFTLWYN
jgi:hypothetical protein